MYLASHSLIRFSRFKMPVVFRCAFMVAMLSSVALSLNNDTVEVSLVSKHILAKTELTYASWNIDSSCNRGFHHINFTNPNLLAAARGLQPSKLRFGGSGNDNLVYGLSPGSPECERVRPTDCAYLTPGCLNATHWGNLHDFAIRSGSDLIFGVSYGLDQACREGAAYSWNSTNAAKLLSHIRAKGQHVWGFELGNEVNNCGVAPCNQTAAQQAAAMRNFAEMAQAEVPAAVLIGPDTGFRNWQAWLEGYLSSVSDSSDVASRRLHAVTHHVYAGINRGNFNSAKTFDGSAAEIDWYTQKLRELAPDAQVWAGEMGPIGGGNDGTCGANSACGTYATTLWYADDLAMRAKHGFAQYQRQDLFGGYYGLTNSPSLEQALSHTDALVLRPDYWINFMWKRTLGPNIHNITSTSQQVRAYGFSGSPPSPFAAPECGTNTAGLQLLLINLDKAHSAFVHLPSIESTSASSKYAAWTLTPPLEGPFSEVALLNDVQLPAIIDASKTDPDALLGKILQPALRQLVSAGISLPPLSTSFICIGGSDVASDLVVVSV